MPWYFIAIISLLHIGAFAQNGPIPTSWVLKTTADGLPNGINAVYVVGNTVYAATDNGLAISYNGGNTFSTSSSNGLTGGYLSLNCVYAEAIDANPAHNVVYVASGNVTTGGFSVSTDGGATFTNTSLFSSNYLTNLVVIPIDANPAHNAIYGTTGAGPVYSTNGGSSFTLISNLGTAWGTVSSDVPLFLSAYSVDANPAHNVIYVFDGAANGGRSAYSTDGGNSFSKLTLNIPGGQNIVNYSAYVAHQSSIGNNYIYLYHSAFLDISSDNGNSFTEVGPEYSGPWGETWSPIMHSVSSLGNTLYVSLWQASLGYANGGVAFSPDLGSSFTNQTTATGFPFDEVYGVFATTNAVYAFTANELAIGVVGAPTPNPPTNVSAVAGDGQATISFTPPTNTGQYPILGYTVTSSPGNMTVTGNSSPIVMTGLTNGTTYTFTITDINGPNTSSPSSPSNAVTPNIMWTGSTSADWFTASNWSSSSVPVSTDYVVVPAVATMPSLTISSQDASVAGITFYAGTSITTGTNNLIVGKSVIFSSNSSINGNLLLNTSNVTTISGIGSIANLIVDGTNGGNTAITSGTSNMVNVTGQLNIMNNALLYTNNNLTLKSTSITNTAVVGAVNGTINGNVIVERFIPDGYRGYRDLGAGVANAGSIYSNWQESGSGKTTNSGYGIYITGGSSANGFDQTATNNPSMYTYNSENWTAVSNTKTTNLDPFQGYRTLVRGDRSFNLGNPPGPSIPQPPPNPDDLTIPLNMADNATLRATGQLITGTVTYTSTDNNPATTSNAYSSTYGLTSPNLDANGYSLITNPYWCLIDWNNMNTANEVSFLMNTYLYFDPTITYTDPTTGLPDETYVSYNSQTGSSNTQSNVSNYIQPGEAFWVQNDGSGNQPQLTINETDKAASSTPTAIFGVPKQLNRLSVTLWRELPVQGNHNIDGTVAVFDNNFSKGVGKEDSKKVMNGGGNVYIKDAGNNLSIDGLPMPVVSDNVAIALSNIAAQGNYQLKIYTNQLATPGVAAQLNDKYLGTTQLLGSDSTVISFTPTSDTNTYANRFSIVFVPNTLPIKFTALFAVKTGNDILVSWSTADEVNLANYTVEKSTDGRTFVSANTQIAKDAASASYSWLDESAVKSYNYYRIKAVGKDGSSIYSNVVSVKLSNNNSHLLIYPNPVSTNSFKVQLNGVAEGVYQLRILNILGQEILSKSVQVSAGSSIQQIDLSKEMATGTYVLKVEGKDGSSYQTQAEIIKP